MNDVQATEAPASLSGSVMFSLIEAAHALEARLEEAFAAVGLSSAKYAVLAKLARGPQGSDLPELDRLLPQRVVLFEHGIGQRNADV